MTRSFQQDAADYLELRLLVDEYAWLTDERDSEGFASLFAEDGELNSTNPGEDEPFFRARGRAELLAVVHNNDQFPRTFHSVSTHRCVVNGETAEGVAYCTAHHLLAEGADTEALVMLIRYHDKYSKTPQGWRFTSRRLELMWVEYLDSDTSDYPFRKGSTEWLEKM